MRIGILETGLPPEDLKTGLGDYPHMFMNLLAGHGFDFRTWSVVQNDLPADALDADGWLITGSRHGVYEDHPWIAPLEQFIRDVRSSGRPMVGICFGHQIMAQAFGGRVEKFAGGWSVGRTTYRFADQDVALNAWHQDQVVEKPEGADVIASSDFCRYAGLSYGAQMMSVQPHPEYSSEFISELIRLRGAAVPDKLKEAAVAQLDVSSDSAWMGTQIAEFFLNHLKT